jgi:hypothetical protein
VAPLDDTPSRLRVFVTKTTRPLWPGGQAHEGGLPGACRQTASRLRDHAPRRADSTRIPTANRFRPASRRQLPPALGHEEKATGEPGQVAPPRSATPERANASAWRDDGSAGSGPCLGRTWPPQVGQGTDELETNTLGWDAPEDQEGPRTGTVSPKEPQGADGDVGESATRSPRDHDVDSHWMWYLASAPRVDTPSGAGAGRVGGTRKPAGQPAGRGASHEGGLVREARTCKPSWLASRVGLGPRRHRRPRTPQRTARASARSESTERTLRRPARWMFQ